MIVVKIYGGLGNQLFQYAIGLKLAKQNNSNLVLDLSWFNKKINLSTKRDFELKYFNLSTNYKNSFKIRLKLLFYNHWLLKRLPFKRKLKIYTDSDSILNRNLNNVYLDGYWHSYNYFSNIRECLLSEFKLNKKFNYNSNFRNKILSTKNSVSVHFRMKDYLYNNNYANCSIKYYKNAMQEFIKKDKNVIFFIFSDDLNSVKKYFSDEKNIIFSENTNNEFSNTIEDFINISACSNHIICNSTFSWWASWLCSNPTKVVIIPNKWFTKNNERAKGYYLQSHIIIEND